MIEEEVGLDTLMGPGLPLPGTSFFSQKSEQAPTQRDVNRAALAEAEVVGIWVLPSWSPPHPPKKEPHSCSELLELHWPQITASFQR